MQSLPSPLWCSARRCLLEGVPEKQAPPGCGCSPMTHPLERPQFWRLWVSQWEEDGGQGSAWIYQVLLWPCGLMWLLWAAAEGQGLMEGTRKAPFVLGTRACGVGWAWLGRRQYLSIGCITLWPFCRGFPSAKIVQIKLVDNKVADDSLTSLPSVAPPPRPPPPPSRSSLVGAVGLNPSCHLCFPLSRLRGAGKNEGMEWPVERDHFSSIK